MNSNDEYNVEEQSECLPRSIKRSRENKGQTPYERDAFNEIRTDSLVQPLMVQPSTETQSESHFTIRFRTYYLFWILSVGMVTAGILVSLSEGSFMDCLFVAINGVTGSGLTTIPLSKFTALSQWVVLLCIQFGSFTLASLIPISIRIHYYRRSLPRILRPENIDLFQYERVPVPLIEYKALLLLRNTVLLYTLACYIFYGLCMYIWIYSSSKHRDIAVHALSENGSSFGSILRFTIFLVISAFTNTGFIISNDSLSKFVDSPFFLFCVNMLILHGNVLFPIFLRWIIVLLNSTAEENSSLRIYSEYLLFQGRDLYHNLFSSQATW